MSSSSMKLVISPNIYQEYTLREQIYKIPDTYIGSVRSSDRIEWLLQRETVTPKSEETNKLVIRSTGSQSSNQPSNQSSSQSDEVQVKKPTPVTIRKNTFRMKAEQCPITLPAGVERIFIEVLSNAGDNVPRSKLNNINPGIIEVTMTSKTITVKNGGCPIPIAVNDQTGKLAPDMIFGTLLTSSNYEGTRLGAGRNGYGIKLCTRKGTLIPLFNGSIKAVEDIKIGEFVIGDDGSKREVIGTTSGYGPLYEISSERGDPYVVSENHVLVVRMPDHKVIFWDTSKQGWHVLWLDKEAIQIRSKVISIEHKVKQVQCPQCNIWLSGNLKRHHDRKHPNKEYVPPPRRGPTVIPLDSDDVRNAHAKMVEFCKTIPDDNTLDISIQDYMKLNPTTRGRLTGFKGDCVQWEHQDVELDPYVLGLWLGDGFQRGYAFAINSEGDPEILEYLREWGKTHDATFTQAENNKYCWWISSTDSRYQNHKAPLRNTLKKYGLLEKKFIPREYMINDRETRLAVLAGLIDSDGHVSREGTRVNIVQGMLHKELAEDIVYLVRSLGLSCYSSIRDTQWSYEGELRTGEAIMMNISGDGLQDIPTKVARKKCNPPVKRELLNTGPLSVRRVDDGYYCGLAITGNQRFVLKDFTVTHNCNIFSKSLTVNIGDSGHEKTYSRTWHNNMIDSDPAVITDGYTGDNYVIVSYDLDFERFGLTEYPEETFGLFARLCADMAYTQQIPVKFNNQIFSFRKPEDFAAMYFGSEIERGFTIYLWPHGTKTIKKGRSYIPDPNDPKNKDIQPIAEVYLVDTVGNNSIISFVNGMMTRDGGSHVNGLVEVLSKMILSFLKDQSNGTTSKGKKGSKKKDEKKERFPLDIRDIKSAVSLIANFHLENPEFTSQSKTCLAAPKPYVHIEEDALQPVYKWKLMDRLYFLLEMKNEAKLSKTDGKKKRFIGPTRADECNWAGGPNSHECILMIVEGNSAMCYGEYVRDCIPNGNDVLGILPIRGKMLNVMNAPAKKILENKEIIEIKRVVGLVEGMDYSEGNNINTLRYGKIMLAADADVDGIHIKGLAINYLSNRFRSLLGLPKGFLFELILPRYRIYHGKEIYKFYDDKQYAEFRKAHPEAANWKVKYFKGLATSKKEDVKEDFKDPKYSFFRYDDNASNSIQLAFDRRLADERKKWIANYQETIVTYSNIKDISDFINYELITFSIEDLKRSVPKFMDGLKVSQRKVLWGTFQNWKSWHSKPIESLDEFKVSQFANYVSQHTRYHHGEKSLEDTIVGMAQDFVGANNLPYLTQDGGFGSRKRGGKDAGSSRYIHTRPNWWLRYVFRYEDFPLMKQINEEGEAIEPVTFYPIIPMCLINGAIGIGTGYSTFIPNHNPIDIIEWYKLRILNQKLPDVYPWYKGFRGIMELIDRNSKKKTIITPTKIIKEISHIPTPEEHNEDPKNSEKLEIEADDTVAELGDDDQNEENKDTVSNEGKKPDIPRLSLVTKGVFSHSQNITHIAELPIGRWTKNYENWLEELAVEKKIKGYRKLNKPIEFPEFEITGLEDPNEKSLKLIKSYGMTNMVLLNNNNVPIKFDSVALILESFYQVRLLIYIDRKKYMLTNLKTQITELNLKAKFILDVREKRLIIDNRPIASVHSDMDQLGLPHDLLDKVKLRGLTQEAVFKLRNKIANLQQEYNTLEITSPEELWYRELEEFEQVYRTREMKQIKIRSKS